MRRITSIWIIAFIALASADCDQARQNRSAQKPPARSAAQTRERKESGASKEQVKREAAARVANGKQGEFPNESLMVGKVTRTYRLVVPKTVDLSAPAPLVIAFHGMLIDSKDLMPKYTALNELAEDRKWILAYPNAVDRRWGISPAKVQADLACFDALVRKLSEQYKVNCKRIYVVGMSNGGYFAHLVARERSTKIAACMSHSGPLGLQTLLGVRAERKFPVMIVHGTSDPLFPIAFARENRDKYTREGHKVTYVEVPELGHIWATDAKINDQLGDFFDANALP